MKPLRYCAIVLLLVWIPVPVAGQSESTDQVSVQIREELKGIRDALDRLVAFRERIHLALEREKEPMDVGEVHDGVHVCRFHVRY